MNAQRLVLTDSDVAHLHRKITEGTDLDGPLCERLGSRCSLWRGGHVPDGRGVVYVPSLKRNVAVARVVWALAHPEWTLGDTPYVLHECDYKPCIRLDHLHAGTPQRNSDEARERGLTPTRANGRHWLSTDEGLARIRRQNADPARNAKIGAASKRIARETWDDPEIRARRVAGIQRAAENRRGHVVISAEGRARIGAAAAEAWADPKKRADRSDAIRTARNTSESKAKTSEASKATARRTWDDPVIRARRVAAIRASAARRRAERVTVAP